MLLKDIFALELDMVDIFMMHSSKQVVYDYILKTKIQLTSLEHPSQFPYNFQQTPRNTSTKQCWASSLLRSV